MKDVSRETIESGRPDSSPLVCINHCIEMLGRDKTRSITEDVVEWLTFEELLGALLHARDLAERSEKW